MILATAAVLSGGEDCWSTLSHCEREAERLLFGPADIRNKVPQVWDVIPAY